MHSLFLLPTAEIIWEHRQWEPLFCFYDEGVRGIVRDLVLLQNHQRDDLPPVYEQLWAQVEDAYERSLNVRYLENTLGQITPLVYIETAVAELDAMVTAMLAVLFGRKTYRVAHDPVDYRWVGDDLLTAILFSRSVHVPRYSLNRLQRRNT